MVEYDYVRTRRADVRPIKDPRCPISVLHALGDRLNVAVFRASKGRLMNRFMGATRSVS